MKATIILAILLLGGLGLQAQSTTLEVLGNGGGSTIQDNAQLTWTLGEISIVTLDDPQATLTQGFNQTSLVVTAIKDDFPQTWEVNAFPNPVSDLLHVRWNETTQPVLLRFTNLSGQVLYQTKVEGTPETQFQVNNYAQGTYFLEVFDTDGTQGKTFKVEVIRN